MSASAQELVGDRQKTHGKWDHTARVSCSLKLALDDARTQCGTQLHPEQQEALDMILAKIARIMSGDPNHPDHWRDIAGYALLGCGDAR